MSLNNQTVVNRMRPSWVSLLFTLSLGCLMLIVSVNAFDIKYAPKEGHTYVYKFSSKTGMAPSYYDEHSPLRLADFHSDSYLKAKVQFEALTRLSGTISITTICHEDTYEASQYLLDNGLDSIQHNATQLYVKAKDQDTYQLQETIVQQGVGTVQSVTFQPQKPRCNTKDDKCKLYQEQVMQMEKYPIRFFQSVSGRWSSIYVDPSDSNESRDMKLSLLQLFAFDLPQKIDSSSPSTHYEGYEIDMNAVHMPLTQQMKSTSKVDYDLTYHSSSSSPYWSLHRHSNLTSNVDKEQVDIQARPLPGDAPEQLHQQQRDGLDKSAVTDQHLELQKESDAKIQFHRQHDVIEKIEAIQRVMIETSGIVALAGENEHQQQGATVAQYITLLVSSSVHLQSIESSHVEHKMIGDERKALNISSSSCHAPLIQSAAAQLSPLSKEDLMMLETEVEAESEGSYEPRVFFSEESKPLPVSSVRAVSHQELEPDAWITPEIIGQEPMKVVPDMPRFAAVDAAHEAWLDSKGMGQLTWNAGDNDAATGEELDVPDDWAGTKESFKEYATAISMYRLRLQRLGDIPEKLKSLYQALIRFNRDRSSAFTLLSKDYVSMKDEVVESTCQYRLLTDMASIRIRANSTDKEFTLKYSKSDDDRVGGCLLQFANTIFTTTEIPKESKGKAAVINTPKVPRTAHVNLLAEISEIKERMFRCADLEPSFNVSRFLKGPELSEISNNLKVTLKPAYDLIALSLTATGAVEKFHQAIAKAHLAADELMDFSKSISSCLANKKELSAKLKKVADAFLDPAFFKAQDAVAEMDRSLDLHFKRTMVAEASKKVAVTMAKTMLGGGSLSFEKKWKKSVDSKWCGIRAYVMVGGMANYQPKRFRFIAKGIAAVGVDVRFFSARRNLFEISYKPGIDTALLPKNILIPSSEYIGMSIAGSPTFPLTKDPVIWFKSLLPQAVTFFVKLIIENDVIWKIFKNGVFKKFEDKDRVGYFLAPPTETVLRLWAKQQEVIASMNRTKWDQLNNNKHRFRALEKFSFFTPEMQWTQPNLPYGYPQLRVQTSVKPAQSPRPRFAAKHPISALQPQVSSQQSMMDDLIQSVESTLADVDQTLAQDDMMEKQQQKFYSWLEFEQHVDSVYSEQLESESATEVDRDEASMVEIDSSLDAEAQVFAQAHTAAVAESQAKHTIRQTIFQRMVDEAKAFDPMLPMFMEMASREGISLGQRASLGAHIRAAVNAEGRQSFPDLLDVVRNLALIIRNQLRQLADTEKAGNLLSPSNVESSVNSLPQGDRKEMTPIALGKGTPLYHGLSKASILFDRAVQSTIEPSILEMMTIFDKSGMWFDFLNKTERFNISTVEKSTGKIGDIISDITKIPSSKAMIVKNRATMPLIVAMLENPTIATALIELIGQLEVAATSITLIFSESESSLLYTRTRRHSGGSNKAHLQYIAGVRGIDNQMQLIAKSFNALQTLLGDKFSVFPADSSYPANLSPEQRAQLREYDTRTRAANYNFTRLPDCRAFLKGPTNSAFEFCRASKSSIRIGQMFKHFSNQLTAYFIDGRKALELALTYLTQTIAGTITDDVEGELDEQRTEALRQRYEGSADGKNGEVPTFLSGKEVEKEAHESLMKDLKTAHEDTNIEFNPLVKVGKAKGADYYQRQPPEYDSYMKGWTPLETPSSKELADSINLAGDAILVQEAAMYNLAGSIPNYGFSRYFPRVVILGLVSARMVDKCFKLLDTKGFSDAVESEDPKDMRNEITFWLEDLSDLIGDTSTVLSTLAGLIDTKQGYPSKKRQFVSSALKRTSWVLDSLASFVTRIADRFAGKPNDKNAHIAGKAGALTCTAGRDVSNYNKIPLFYKKFKIFDITLGPFPVWGVPVVVGLAIGAGLGITIESGVCAAPQGSSISLPPQFLIVPQVFFEAFGEASVGVGFPGLSVGVMINLQFIGLHLPVNLIFEIAEKAPLAIVYNPTSKEKRVSYNGLTHNGKLNTSDVMVAVTDPKVAEAAQAAAQKTRMAVWLKPYLTTLSGSVNLYAKFIITFYLRLFSWQGFRYDLPNSKLCWDIPVPAKRGDAICPGVPAKVVDAALLDHPANPATMPTQLNSCFPCNYNNPRMGWARWECPLYPERYAMLGATLPDFTNTEENGAATAFKDYHSSMKSSLSAEVAEIQNINAKNIGFMAICGESVDLQTGQYRGVYFITKLASKNHPSKPIDQTIIFRSVKADLHSKSAVKLQMDSINVEKLPNYRSLRSSYVDLAHRFFAQTNLVRDRNLVWTALDSPSPSVELLRNGSNWMVGSSSAYAKEAFVPKRSPRLLLRKSSSLYHTHQCVQCNIIDSKLVCPTFGRRQAFAKDDYVDSLSDYLNRAWEVLKSQVDTPTISVCSESVEESIFEDNPQNQYKGRYRAYLFIEGAFKEKFYKSFRATIQAATDDIDEIRPEAFNLGDLANGPSSDPADFEAFQVICDHKHKGAVCEVYRAPRAPHLEVREAIYRLYLEFTKDRLVMTSRNDPCFIEPLLTSDELSKMSFVGTQPSKLIVKSNQLCFKCTTGTISSDVTCKYDPDTKDSASAQIRVAGLNIQTQQDSTKINSMLDSMVTRVHQGLLSGKTSNGVKYAFETDYLYVCDERTASFPLDKNANSRPVLSWEWLRGELENRDISPDNKKMKVTVKFGTRSASVVVTVLEMRALYKAISSSKSIANLAEPKEAEYLSWYDTNVRIVSASMDAVVDAEKGWGSDMLVWSSTAFRQYFYGNKNTDTNFQLFGPSDLTPKLDTVIGGWLCGMFGFRSLCFEYHQSLNSFILGSTETPYIQAPALRDTNQPRNDHPIMYFFRKSVAYRNQYKAVEAGKCMGADPANKIGDEGETEDIA